MKKYSFDDLVKDKTKIKEASGAVLWLARDYIRLKNPEDPRAASAEPRLDDQNHLFILETCDDIRYEFDVTTGLIKNFTPPNSQSTHDDYAD